MVDGDLELARRERNAGGATISQHRMVA
jgi:hypothetical protein